MHRYIFIFVLVVLALFGGGVGIYSYSHSPQKSQNITISSEQRCDFSVDGIINSININRKLSGADTLNRDSYLDRYSLLRAEELTGSLDNHVGFDKLVDSGVFNGGYTYVGENLSSGRMCDVTVINGWMGSDGHKKNILNSRYNSVGIGFNQKSGVVVAIFGDLR